MTPDRDLERAAACANQTGQSSADERFLAEVDELHAECLHVGGDILSALVYLTQVVPSDPWSVDGDVKGETIRLLKAQLNEEERQVWMVYMADTAAPLYRVMESKHAREIRWVNELVNPERFPDHTSERHAA